MKKAHRVNVAEKLAQPKIERTRGANKPTLRETTIRR